MTIALESKPLASFLIAAFNAEPFICATVDSCLKQTYPNVEVVVTDDGSTDGTLRKLRENYSDNKRVKILSFERNRGKVAAYNHCFASSAGGLIAIMGADDLSVPSRVEHSMEVMRESGSEMVCGDCIAFEDGREISANLAWDWFGLSQAQDITFDSQLRRPKVFGGTLLMTRKLAEELFPIDESLGHEDWWLPLAAAYRQPVHYISESLLKYRFHSDNTSRNSPQIDFDRWLKLSVREIPYYELVRKKFELTPTQDSICRCRRTMLELLAEPCFGARLSKVMSNAGLPLASGVPWIDRLKFLMAAASPKISFHAARWLVRRKRS